jgi:glycerophosphoryl diester phosphodiesterase
MKRAPISFALVAGLSGVVAFLLLRKGEARVPQRDWPVNFAHRGDSAHAPENTLEAFRLAVERGAGGLELDVHLTRDGEVVVLHDETVDRTTDGTGAVAEMTLEEVRALDAGYRFGAPEYPYRGRGCRVPTLAEVFEEFPEAVINLEIKAGTPGIEKAVLDVIEAARAEGRSLVASGRHEVVRRFRDVSGGEIPTSASYREIEVFHALCNLRVASSLSPDYDALQVPVSWRGITIVTPRFVAAASAAGVRVDAWTIDDAAEMRRLLDLGVGVIMTNHPERLARVLAEREGG